MARNFVAASSQVLIASSTPITASPFTMACWFNSTTLGTAYGVFSLSDGTTSNRWAINTSAANLITGVCIAAGVSSGVNSSAAFGAGWHHGCHVVASSTNRTIYLDGGNSGNTTTARTPTGINTVHIGDTGGGTGFYNGNVAEAAIWNVALSAADVAMLASGVSPLLVRPAALVGYWPLRHGYSPEIDLVSTRTAAVTGATVVAHPRVLLPSRSQLGTLAASIPPSGGLGPDQWRRLALKVNQMGL